MPLPVPEAPPVIDSHDASEVAVHPHVEDVVTATVPVPPLAPTVIWSGATLNAQGAGVGSGGGVGVGAGVGVGVGVGVGAGVGVGVGVGAGVGVGVGAGAGVGVGVGVGVGAGAPACSIDTTWPAMSALPVRDPAAFASAVRRIVPGPDCDVALTRTQGSCGTAVHAHAADAVSTRTVMLPPDASSVAVVGVTEKRHGAASCAMTTCASFTVTVPRRVVGSTFGLTR